MKSVRAGCTYEFIGYDPDHKLKPGSIVTVVNVPGGSRGGIFRNVKDMHGNIHFVDIRNLTRK
jgi:hypothetical protein